MKHPSHLHLLLAAFTAVAAAAAEPISPTAVDSTPASPASEHLAATNGGDREALVLLGHCYAEGRGVPARADIAYSCFLRAGALGSAAGKYEAAICEAAGWGTAASAERASASLRLAAQAGHLAAVQAMQADGLAGLRGQYAYILRTTTVSPRFGAEATRLFQAISESWRTGGHLHPATPSAGTVTQVRQSTDRLLAEIARLSQEAEALEAAYPGMAGKAQAAVGGAQGDMARGLPGFLFSDGTLDDANRLLDQTLSGYPYEAIQKVLNLQLALQQMLNERAAKVREFAAQSKPVTTSPTGGIAVQLTVPSLEKVHVAVTNRTGQPLRHCLLLSRAEPNRAAIRGSAARDQTLAPMLNDLVRIRREHTEASMANEKARTSIYCEDHGELIYISEIPAGLTVEVPLCDPTLMPTVQKVDVTLWSDEVSFTSPPVTNFKAAQAAYEALRRSGQTSQSPDASSGRAASPPAKRSTLGQWKNPLDEPARRR